VTKAMLKILKTSAEDFALAAAMFSGSIGTVRT